MLPNHPSPRLVPILLEAYTRCVRIKADPTDKKQHNNNDTQSSNELCHARGSQRYCLIVSVSHVVFLEGRTHGRKSHHNTCLANSRKMFIFVCSQLLLYWYFFIWLACDHMTSHSYRFNVIHDSLGYEIERVSFLHFPRYTTEPNEMKVGIAVACILDTCLIDINK